MQRMTSVAMVIVIAALIHAVAADTPQVALNTSRANPRAVESLTERAILRDYTFAWTNLEQAFESSSTAPLNSLFVGNAGAALNGAVGTQKASGMSSRYLNQNHKVDAVFYSPEGDVIELHDTAEYDLQILDGSKTIHQEHTIAHFVVLMTPGADRWVVRQLQSVQQF